MSNGIFRKIGLALSIFGVSNPDDIRRMQAKKNPIESEAAKPELTEPPTDETSSQEKRTTED